MGKEILTLRDIEKRFSANKDQEGFLKAKILDPFNTKSYAKIILAL